MESLSSGMREGVTRASNFIYFVIPLLARNAPNTIKLSMDVPENIFGANFFFPSTTSLLFDSHPQ